ncbi:Crp/Fnr family transcriptional regulator [Amycolatopsis sp. BJA-103]|uniref:Crp/Fnr family transcriptional regulator n=1 Tax=unclassified Amycolatopsis TaxID=2618356 RepID=UPI000C78A2EA|nr:Crp/Fnr family transcriptional regulator [Amycolatopsis sp. BJA-103]AUI62779.1 cyclic nucleotide-binding protein [Amycolatopsis sp. BJA-103]PNE18620.1 cyclic nucleotide-binding protein [Amycolatopsis sp. BJA-103]
MGGDFLAAVTERQRQRLLELGKHVDYATGTTLLNQGDPAPPVLILRSGFVKAIRAAQGGTSPMIVDLLGAGDVLGVEDCLARRSSHLSFVATKPVRVLEVPQNAFHGFLDDDKQAMALIALDLAVRLRLRNVALGFATAKVRCRLTAFLTRLQALYGVPGESGVVIDVGLNHTDIASAIGASPASVNAEMAKLKNEGYLSTGYKTIHVKKRLREDGPPLSPARAARPRRIPQMRLGRRVAMG